VLGGYSGLEDKNCWFRFQFQLVKTELELGLSFGTSSRPGTGSEFWKSVLELELGLIIGTGSRTNSWFHFCVELKPKLEPMIFEFFFEEKIRLKLVGLTGG